MSALADRQAIQDQLARYCRAVDRLDHALGYAVWHPDGTADYGADQYQGSGRGFIDHVIRQHRQLLAHSHQLGHSLIGLDGERAASETYVHAALQMERDGKRQRLLVHCRYLDRWSKRDGVWAIDHRHTVTDLCEIAEVMAGPLHNPGLRGRDDPSYALPGFA